VRRISTDLSSGLKVFMRRSFRLSTFVLLAVLMPVIPPLSAANDAANLSKIVVIGDSLSAGFQDFSLFDANSSPTSPFPPLPGGQQYGFAAVVAHQAGHDLTLPLFSNPGIPFNFTNPALYPLFGRENPATQTNNLSVPGFTVANAIANPYPGNPTNGIDAMSGVILGTPQVPATVFGCGPIPAGTGFIVSELACAIALRPTFVLASIGSNDALQAVTLGIQPTNAQLFAAQYTAFIAGLASTGAKIVVTNIADVTAIPFLIPVPVYAFACHGAPLPSGATANDFIVANLAAQLGPDYLNPCKNPVVRTAALVQQARDAVSAYNNTIARVASTFGAAVVDVNGLFEELQQNGYPLSKTKTLTTAAGGGLFSLDNIHPTNTGYAILANATINTMKKSLKIKLPLVDVNAVAAADPLVH
jgi:lysophospholipase L1-like esterase